MDDLIVTVSQLNEYIAKKLYRDTLMQNIRVQGEITNFKLHTSGTAYFSLKDSISAIPCAMFGNADTVPFEIKDGKKVIVTASVNFYSREGRLNLSVQKIEISGFGELYLQFEQTKKRLYDEGLFDANHKRKLPMFPKRLGVVTSASGAAMHDIIQVAKRRLPGIKIDIYPAKVQGEGAAAEIIDGIVYFNREKTVDVIIVGRGGGSFEDLSAFNDEKVARAIFASDIPIVSAVGHEIDMTISDFTADLRAPTPSAAAELCVPELSAILETLKSFKKRLSMLMLNGIALKRSLLETEKNIFFKYSPDKTVERLHNELNNYMHALKSSIFSYYNGKFNTFHMAKSYFLALNPLNTLKRGYAIIKNKAGQAVSSIMGMQAGDKLQIVLFDGLADVKVDRIHYNGGAG